MSAVWLIIFTAALAVFLYKYFKYRSVVKRLQHIPALPEIPFFGHAFDYPGPTKILQGFQELAREYGGIFRLSVFWSNSLIICDYKHTEELLSTTRILNKGDEYKYIDKWLGTGLLTSGPEKWRKTRKIITPAFHFQILEQFIYIFDSCTDILISKLKGEVENDSTDIYKYVTLCTLDVICESAMGTKVDAQINSDSKYVASVKEMSRIIRDRIFSPIKMIQLFYYFSGDYRKENDALKIMHDYTTKVIRKRREEMLENISVGKKENKRLVFLDLLLQSNIDGRPMTDQEIREEVDTFMFEGHDTTASAISSALYCLAHNKDIQDKVVEEQNEIFEKDKFRSATYNDLQNMRYLEMVIKEALRLFPSVPLYARKVVEDTKFGDKIIPKDVSLVIFTWGLHRDPELYPDPEKFDPERFSLESQNERNPFAYVPFSAGPRNCIGQRFAMLEMKATLSKLLRNFEFLPVLNFERILVPDLILKSLNGVELCVRNRHF